MDDSFVPMSVEDAFKVFDEEVSETVEMTEISTDEAFSVLGQNEPAHDLQ